MGKGRREKTWDGKPYLIGEDGYRVLALYVRDYERSGGAIMGGGHLILGNTPSGSLDSTSFGLVTKSGFIGKMNVGAKKSSDYAKYKKFRPSLKKCSFSDVQKRVNFKMAKDASLDSSLWEKNFRR